MPSENVIYRCGAFYLRRRGGTRNLEIVWVEKGIRKSVSAKTKSVDEGRVRLIQFASERQPERNGKPVVEDWFEYAHKMHMLKAAGARSNKKEYGLTASYIYALLEKQNFRCAASGIRFDIRRGLTEGKRNPWLPTLDRIDCGDGYIPGNVRVVCLIANVAMSDWGYDSLLRLANGVAMSALATAEEPAFQLRSTEKTNPLQTLEN